MSVAEFLGQVLHVDLATGQCQTEPVDEGTAQALLGGLGLNSKLAYDLFPPGVAPLSSENLIILGAGSLAGTLAPATSKILATTKFPVTGCIGTAFGGTCGDALKYAGYSQVVIKGKAPRPVCLRISDDQVELVDGSEFWGRDIWETTDELRRRYGSQASVVAIGLAGERLLGISFAYCNKLGHLGQGGLGAVMGSKNLKAVLIQGSKGVRVANPKAFMDIVNPLVKTLMGLSYREDWIRLGSSIAVWGRASTWEKQASNLYGVVEYLKDFQGTLACPSCPVGCKFAVAVKDEGGSPFLVPISGMSSAARNWEKLNVGDIHQALRLRSFCNRHGIEDGAASSVIDLAVTLFERGAITGRDTGGLELKRDYTTARTLLERMLRREGLGDLLADGYGQAVARFGPGAQGLEGVVKGHELMADPRKHFHPWNLAEVVNPRGSGGIPGNSPAFVPGHPPEDFVRYLQKMHLPEEAIQRVCANSTVNMGRLTRYTEDWYSLLSCLGICARQPVSQSYTVDLAARLQAAATGWQGGPRELLQVAERAWNVAKALNVREGFTRKDDHFPDEFFQPLIAEGKTFVLKDYYGQPLDRANVEKLLDDYYEERGWEVARGIPTRAKLLELGLDSVVADLDQRGLLPD